MQPAEQLCTEQGSAASEACLHVLMCVSQLEITTPNEHSFLIGIAGDVQGATVLGSWRCNHPPGQVASQPPTISPPDLPATESSFPSASKSDPLVDVGRLWSNRRLEVELRGSGSSKADQIACDRSKLG